MFPKWANFGLMILLGVIAILNFAMGHYGWAIVDAICAAINWYIYMKKKHEEWK